MSRTQREDEKNELICLVMFSLAFMVIMVIYATDGSFFVFSADERKKSVTVWKKYLSASGRSHLALLANAI